jgi:uncharacterized protein YbaP (TraB family)
MRARLLLLLAGFAACDESTPPLMWSVAAEGQPACHLLGTIHLGVSARGDLPRVVWDRFDAAARVGTEAEIRSVDKKLYRHLTGLTQLTDRTLDQLLAADVWSALRSSLGAEVTTEELRTYRPYLAGWLLYHTFVPAGIEGMDLTLLDAADSAGTPLFFLETWQDQIHAMNTLTLQQDVENLTWLVKNRAQVKDRIEELISLYKAGDAEGVERVAPEAGAVPARDDPFFDTYIRQRNLKWLPEIEEQIKQGDAFFAVGFGHVLGPDGLVQSLTKRGYTVRRVE